MTVENILKVDTICYQGTGTRNYLMLLMEKLQYHCQKISSFKKIEKLQNQEIPNYLSPICTFAHKLLKKMENMDATLKPLFSEFADDTMPQVQSPIHIKPSKVITKRKREKRRRSNADSDESSFSDENEDIDEDDEEEDKEKEAEEVPAWIRYLPPRRFIKVKNPAKTSTTTTTTTASEMDIGFNNIKDEGELKNELKQRKRIKYNTHAATEAAALLSFFNLEKENDKD